MTFVLKLAEEELYQNYKEKALHNDSDEDADSRGPKPDNGIVVQYRPIRTSWSQLSVVRLNALYFPSSLSIQDTDRNKYSVHLWLCLRSSGMLELPGMLSYPVWLQSIPILPLPLPPFFIVCWEYRSIFFMELGGQGGRQSARPTGSTAWPGASVLDSSAHSSYRRYVENSASEKKCSGPCIT